MFKKSNSGKYTEVIKGVHLKTLVYGDQTLMIEVKFKKGAVIPPHGHPHEQTGYLISGKISHAIDSQNHEMNPGDSWNIPGDVEHSVEVHEDTLVVEVFSPVREDYIQK